MCPVMPVQPENAVRELGVHHFPKYAGQPSNA
jgi:hypothetical protein